MILHKHCHVNVSTMIWSALLCFASLLRLSLSCVLVLLIYPQTPINQSINSIESICHQNDLKRQLLLLLQQQQQHHQWSQMIPHLSHPPYQQQLQQQQQQEEKKKNPIYSIIRGSWCGERYTFCCNKINNLQHYYMTTNRHHINSRSIYFTSFLSLSSVMNEHVQQS